MKQELDYKKLYEEARGRAKAWHRRELAGTQKEMAEYIFPDLKESEDERIRKAIRLVLIATEDEQKAFYSTHGLTRKDCTDWLEKQKPVDDAIAERDVIKSVTINGLPPVMGNKTTDIRPWKPSEEQMKALELVVNFLKPRKDTYEPKKVNALESLYNELMEISEDKTYFWDRNDFPEGASDEEIFKSLISLINWSGTPWSSSDKDKYKEFLNNMFEFGRHGFENGFVSERNRIRARVQDCLRPYLAKSDRQLSYHDTGIIKGLNWVLKIIDDGIKI